VTRAIGLMGSGLISLYFVIKSRIIEMMILLRYLLITLFGNI